MLAYVLALMVGIGSFGLYMAAFFFPEVHRKNDFIWSGIGLFYALVLWVSAERVTGGLLLGQLAGVGLMGWLGWQMLLLRRQVAPLDQQTPVPTPESVKTAFSNLASADGRSQLTQQVSRTAGQLKHRLQAAIAAGKQASSQTRSAVDETYVPPSMAEFGTAAEEVRDRFAKANPPEPSTPDMPPLVESEPPAPTAETTSSQDTTDIKNATASQPVKLAESERSPRSIRRSTTPTESKLVKQAPNRVQGLMETVQSLTQRFGRKPIKPVYIRKQFRDQPAESNDQIMDATIIAVIEDANRAADGSLVTEATIEITSDELAPDLLATALSPVDVQAGKTDEIVAEIADIVVELLEDITAQEQNSEASAELEPDPSDEK